MAPIQTCAQEPRENGRQASATRTDSAPGERPGIGRIPPLPRPKFLQAIAQFALGE
jgi:hypothetical protein